MIDRLREKLPKHNIIVENSLQLYIVDYKQINKGNVVLHNADPNVPNVYLKNENGIEIYFDGFLENALEIEPGNCSKQCECILFPTTCNASDWILCVETKYVYNIENAFRESNDYPNCMIDQVIETVEYFRNAQIIEEERRVNAIVAFPTLISDFSAYFFTGERTVESILRDYNIKMRAINHATVVSEKRIKI